MSHPDSAQARALGALEAEDARIAGLVPPREPDPLPWEFDEEGIDTPVADLGSSVAARAQRDGVVSGAGDPGAGDPDDGGGDPVVRTRWPRVCLAGDLASPAHVPLAVGGQSPLALLELVATDLEALHPGELLDALTAAEQLKAWLDAQQLGALSTLSDWCETLRGVGPQRDQVPVEAMAGAEAGPALGVTPRTAALRVGLARDLRRLPVTRQALRSGRITLSKARAVSEALLGLDDTDAAQVESRVLARHGGSTLPNLTAALRRAVIAVDPAAAEERHRRAVKSRGVWREALEDGLSRLEWIAPADQVETAHAALTAAARAAQATDRLAARTARDARQPEPDVRTLDEARSDVLADLTGDQLGGLLHDDHPSAHHSCGHAGDDGAPNRAHPDNDPAGQADRGSASGDPASGDPASGDPASGGPAGDASTVDCRRRRGRAPVGVVVGLTTLLGLDDRPGELPGYGPIPASMARRLAAEGAWRRILTDAVGRVLDFSTRAHDPPPDLAAFVQARDRTCRFPGCRMPAVRCDIDHNEPHPDGETSAANLCCLCRTHHRIKTLTDTGLTNDGHGRVTWTMPSGKTWTTDPPPALDDPPDDPPDDTVPAESLTGDSMIDEPPF